MRLIDTHEVDNQVPPILDVNWLTMDVPLQEALQREGVSTLYEQVSEFGKALGTFENQHHGILANIHKPELHTFDRYGHRIDEVEFHPSYHHLMQEAKSRQIHSIPWLQSGGHVAHTAMEYILTQVEPGICCPITMTYAAVPALEHNSDIDAQWRPKIIAGNYDGRHLAISDKKSAMIGMAMTEKQGGSDVRANSTKAVHQSGDVYLLTGHKWFCSAPMSDAFLTLANTPKGLTCFFVPRFTDDGDKNRFFIQRLKNKLGNHANASSEIEYNQTWARRVGEEGRGVATIIEMVHHTRLDCATAAVALMRQSLFQAMHHAKHRRAFGKLLIHQPLMRNVLADLAIEWEANLTMIFRVARAYDHGQNTKEAAFARWTVAIAKYWSNKRCSYFVNEAMECLGGLGYVEDSVMPRLYREAPLNGIWEGSGNVICLDVLRAMGKQPHVVDIFWAELCKAKGLDGRFDQYLQKLSQQLKDDTDLEYRARFLTEQLALALQAALLLQHGHPAIVEGFLSTRLQQSGGRAFGTLPVHIDIESILSRIIEVAEN